MLLDKTVLPNNQYQWPIIRVEGILALTKYNI